MKSWQLAVVALALLGLAGCRTDPNIVLLERENRLLEDEVYRLREIVQDCQGVPGASVEDELSAEPSRAAPEPAGPLLQRILPEGVPDPAEATGTSSALPSETTPGADPGTAPPWSPPSPESIPDDRPTDDVPEPASDPIDPGILELIPPGIESRHRAAEAGRVGQVSLPGPADSRQVARLALDERLTGGHNADGRPGDEGIVAVIEPRDSQGLSVAAPADVSVVVLDPAMPGEKARVARWDLTAEQVAASLRRAGPGSGIPLKLTWPADPPEHEDLHVFVRYVTADGRKLQADRRIRIELPTGSSFGWMPATQPVARPPAAPPAVVSQAPPPAPKIDPPIARTAARPTDPQRPVWSPDRQ